MLKEALKFLIILDENGTPLFSYGDKEFTESDAAVSGDFQMIKLIQDQISESKLVAPVIVNGIEIYAKQMPLGFTVILGTSEKLVSQELVEPLLSEIVNKFAEIYLPILKSEEVPINKNLFKGFSSVLSLLLKDFEARFDEFRRIRNVKGSVYFSYEPEKTTMKVGEPCKIIIRVYNGYSRSIHLKKVEDAYLKDADAKVDVSGVECNTGVLIFKVPKELKPGKSEEICLEIKALEPSSGRFLYPTLYIGLTKSKEELIEISDGTYSFDVTE